MHLKTLFLSLPALASAIAIDSAPTSSSGKISVKDVPGYGSGGRYGFKKCDDKGYRPGKVSCLNFDSLPTSPKSGVSVIPSSFSTLKFSPQYSVINFETASNTIPDANSDSAVSKPNAIIGSRYNPEDKKDKSPATFYVETGSFDLFGFWIQNYDSPPPGVRINVTGFRSGGGKPFFWSTHFESGSSQPLYFDSLEMAGPEKWDGLEKVEISAGFGDDEYDWEFFIDDIWLRWGAEKDSAVADMGFEDEL